MKKYFCCSDIHGFYDIFMNALKKHHFDIDNPEHILIICGDIFDRGPQSLELYNFLRNFPRERRILIRGNHEYLFRDMVNRGYAENHDYHNMTIDTLYQLNNWNDEEEVKKYYRGIVYVDELESAHSRRMKLFKSDITREVVDWFASDEWVDYFETHNYIFVHGFIPLQQHIDWPKSQLYNYIIKDGQDTFREDWRNALPYEWEDATWFNWRQNYQLVKDGLNQTGKYIVVGHWHTSDLYLLLNGTKKKSVYDCPIYKSKKYKIIGLDACTAGSNKVNVLVLTEEQL